MRGVRRFSLLLLPSIMLAWSCATAPEWPTSDVDPTEPEADASPARKPKKPGAPSAPTGVPVPAPEPGPISDAGTDTSATVPTKPPPVFPSDTPRASRGDIVVTEIMFDPTGPEPASEWIEVWNGRSSARSLSGLTLKDGAGRTHVIVGGPGEVAVASNAYVVLVRDRAAAISSGVPADAIVYEYGAKLSPSEGIQLANGTSGLIALLDGDAEVTSVAYGAYELADVEGRSCQADVNGEWSLAPATPGSASRAATR